MPAATCHRRYYLCALVGAFALAAAPVVDAQLAARRAHASTAAAQPPQGRLKAAPPAGAAPAGVAWAGAQDVAIFALGMIGVDYRFGGHAPETRLSWRGALCHT